MKIRARTFFGDHGSISRRPQAAVMTECGPHDQSGKSCAKFFRNA
jgi:hypothetical protein